MRNANVSSPMVNFRYAQQFLIPNPSFLIKLHDSLCHHGICHLHKSSDVGTLNVVDISVRFFAILHALLMDVVHDLVEILVHLLLRP